MYENDDIEEILLGKLIVNNELIDKYYDLLHDDLFEDPFNKSTFIAIKELKSKLRYKILPYPKRPDAVEVSREIRTNTIGEGEGQYLDTAQ